MSKRKIAKKTGKKELDELKSQLARALADYDNLRKRIEREKEEVEMIAGARFAIKALSIFDMLEEAQKHLKDPGIALTIEEFEKVIKEEGIEKIKVEQGEKFDEELHEAVEVVSPPAGAKSDLAGGGKKDGKIARVVLTGWKFFDGPVIRPAKVRVYRKEEH
jgi:molecular chaperone GrpE